MYFHSYFHESTPKRPRGCTQNGDQRTLQSRHAHTRARTNKTTPHNPASQNQWCLLRRARARFCLAFLLSRCAPSVLPAAAPVDVHAVATPGSAAGWVITLQAPVPRACVHNDKGLLLLLGSQSHPQRWSSAKSSASTAAEKPAATMPNPHRQPHRQGRRGFSGPGGGHLRWDGLVWPRPLCFVKVLFAFTLACTRFLRRCPVGSGRAGIARRGCRSRPRTRRRRTA